MRKLLEDLEHDAIMLDTPFDYVYLRLYAAGRLATLWITLQARLMRDHPHLLLDRAGEVEAAKLCVWLEDEYNALERAVQSDYPTADEIALYDALQEQRETHHWRQALRDWSRTRTLLLDIKMFRGE